MRAGTVPAGRAGEPGSPAGGVGQGPCRRLGLGVRGDGAAVGGGQQADRHVLLQADEGDRPRLSSRSCGEGPDQIVTRRRGDRGGDEGEQHGVDPRIRHEPVDALAQLVLRYGRGGVHGIADGRTGRQHGQQVVDESGSELRQDEPRFGAGVGGQHARAAGVGDDGDAGPHRVRLGVEQGRGGQEFADRVGGGDAGLGEQGLPGHGAGRCGRRVRGGGSSAGVGAARVDGEDGHAAGDAPSGAGESPRVTEGLQVQQGEVGTAVALPPLEHVVAADVVLVAEGGERGHADAQAGQPVEQSDAHTTGLHGHTRTAGLRVTGGERRIQAQGRVGVGDTEAVGAYQAHAVGTACGQERLRLSTVQAC